MKRNAMVLIVVLVAVAALSLAALAFSALMVSEREVVHITGQQIQARALAESGIEMARLFLIEQPDVQYSEGVWYEDAESFQGVLLLDDGSPQGRGRFSIIAPATAAGEDQSSGEVRFGLECESAKLNLNTLLDGDGDEQSQRERLMALPGMSEDIADAILDWLDDDDETREYGAEAGYYESLENPYHPTNGPIRCLEELLFVRGVTSEHLYGTDRNRNGRLDDSESDVSGSIGIDSAEIISHRGWSAYLTLSSREKVAQPDGTPKIDLNQEDAETLYEELEEAFDSEWATFIVGYRQQEQLYSENDSSSDQENSDSKDTGNSQNGSVPASSDAKNSGDNDTKEEEVEQAERAEGELDLSKPLKQKLDNILVLIGSKIKVKYKNSEKSTVVAPLFPDDPDTMLDYLSKLMDHATVGTEESITGRVNVNLAPAAVLASVPGLDADLAESIVGRRPADPLSLDTHQQHATWLLIEGLVKLEKMKTLLPYLTAGGSVYKVQTVGFFDKGGPVVRLEAVVDAGESPPRMLSLKDLTPLGPGFNPLELGAEE